MIKTSFRALAVAAILTPFMFASSPSLAYKPASQAEEDAIKAAMAGDMRKAFGIMKEAIDKAEAEGDTAAVDRGI